MKRHTVMLIAKPSKVNLILAELADVEIEDISLQPITLDSLLQDVMITYQVDVKSADEALAHLAWMEQTIGEPFCKIY